MSIRLRLATVFTIATAVIFAFGAWLFVFELSSGLLNLLDSQLKADLVQAGRLVSTPAKSRHHRTSRAGSGDTPGLRLLWPSSRLDTRLG